MTLLARIVALATARAEVMCNGTFTPITVSAFASGLNPGWNTGNSMDAMPTETSWGQPLLVNSTFANVKNHGFKGVRLPVTCADHFISESPSWTIDPVWLQRVSDVIEMVTSNGMYAIVNAHHDSWSWLDPTAANANLTMMQEKFYRLRYQVGTKLACNSNIVAFEALNEPSGSSASDAAFLTSLQTIFIRAINDAGGFNTERVIVLAGMGDSWTSAVSYFQRPSSNVMNPWILTYHYYGPSFGRTIWGRDVDKQALENEIAQAQGNFTDVPLLIGEFATPPPSTETAARWKWYDFITRTASKYNTSVMLWDAGGSFEGDSPHPWQDPTAIDIIMNAANGISNALADSTEDPNEETQFTSAYLFYKQGDPIQDTSLPFLWNGNALLRIKSSANSSKLSSNTDCVVNGTNLTFKSSFMSRLFKPGSSPGFKANLTLHFNTGADLQLQAYQWAPPILSSISSTVTNATAQNDLSIPITWKGKPQLATVKAQMGNRSYLVDTWTQYLGPSQKGRMTCSGQWDFDDQHVVLKAKALQAVLAANVSTVFTFEFYPRVPDNVVNYTVAVGVVKKSLDVKAYLTARK